MSKEPTGIILEIDPTLENKEGLAILEDTLRFLES